MLQLPKINTESSQQSSSTRSAMPSPMWLSILYGSGVVVSCSMLSPYQKFWSSFPYPKFINLIHFCIPTESPRYVETTMSIDTLLPHTKWQHTEMAECLLHIDKMVPQQNVASPNCSSPAYVGSSCHFFPLPSVLLAVFQQLFQFFWLLGHSICSRLFWIVHPPFH